MVFIGNNMRKSKILLLLFMTMAVFGWQCVDKYNSPYQSPATGYLVVEGYITGNGPTQFTLSRTIPLPGDSTIPMETGAKVQVEGSDNSVYPLTEQNAGIYTIDTLALNTATRYRLRIATTDGQQYLSSYTPYIPTPPIDSISWVDGSSGITIYANTHGPAGTTGYYQWTYNETWEYSATYPTGFIYENGSIMTRTPAQMKTTCWETDSSTDIIVGSTARLGQNVVYEQPVQTIAAGSIQLSTLYSILVRQYVLTDSAYTFLNLMKQNSESLGSIFDPQPIQLTGNIQCLTNPIQPVIGWVSAGTLQQQRIFISRVQVPEWSYSPTCPLPAKTLSGMEVKVDFPAGTWTPLTNTSDSAALTECTDCTLQGGTTTKPSFWPN
jgi:hypothetical protein